MVQFDGRAKVAVTIGLAASVGTGVAFALRTGNGMAGLRAGLAIALASFIVTLTTSLPARVASAIFLGVAIPVAAMMAWTHLAQPRYVWAVQLVIGAVAAVVSYPWWRGWWAAARLGSFWLLIPCWVLGLIAPLALARWTVVAQRIVYLAYAAVILLMLVRLAKDRHREVSLAFAAGLLWAHAALLVAGCQYFFKFTGGHATSQSAWGYAQTDRFWGGPALVYHPNFIGMTVVIAAARIGPDRSLRPWQRLGVLFYAGLVLVAVKSRTSLLIALAAAVAFFIGYVWQHGLPRWRAWRWLSTGARRRVVAVGLLPMAVWAAALIFSGGSDLLLKSRYDDASAPPASATDPTVPATATAVLSGRPQVWRMVLRDFREARPIEQVFGTAANSRGYLLRITDHSDPQYATQPKLTADNGPLGALRRGGVLGFVTFCVGFVIVAWRTVRFRLPLWIPVSAVAILLTAATEDEITGSTPAWVMLAAIELYVLYLLPRKEAAGDAESAGADHERLGAAAEPAALIEELRLGQADAGVGQAGPSRE